MSLRCQSLLRDIGIVESGNPVTIPLYTRYKAVQVEDLIVVREVKTELQHLCSLVLQIIDFSKFQGYALKRN